MVFNHCGNDSLNQLFNADDYPSDAFYLKKAIFGKPVILYGAGESSHWFVEIVVKMHGYKPVAVLDKRFKPGDTYEGIPAYSPEEYFPNGHELKEGVVVVAIGNPKYQDEIVTAIKSLGFNSILFLSDIYEIHNPFSQPAELFNQGFAFYLSRKKQIYSAFELFKDAESKAVFRCFLETHMRRKPVPIPMRPRQEQYFPRDIALSQSYDRFVNCGAYDGETIRQLHEAKGKVDSIACFETEPALFEKLAAYLRNHKYALAEQIIALPCAVYSRQGLMKYTGASGLGSRLSETGDTVIQCIALDDVLPNFNPTMICMDIEGAELAALRGAEQCIRENRPDLAVCVYHSPEHLWEIPLYLHGLNLGYRFYLRNYTGFTIETVLYATA